MANVIKKFFGKFAKKKTASKNNSANNVQVIEIKEGARVSSTGYSIGDSETEEYQASVLLTELRSQSNVGEQLELIVAMYLKQCGLFNDYVCKVFR